MQLVKVVNAWVRSAFGNVSGILPMGWFVARHASRTRLLAVAYLEKSRRREGKFNDSSEKQENFPLGKALQCLHPRQVGKLLNDLHQESLTATSSHQQVLFFNDPTSLDQHWNQGGTCCWLSAPKPEMVWRSRSQAAAVTGAWYWKPLRLVTFWTN